MARISLGQNTLALSVKSRLDKASSQVASASERLSSGLRINRASDDAAGLSISTSLNAQTRVFNQAARNINDGVSFLSIAEGALDQLSDITIRQKELAEQAANGSLSARQRLALHKEASALTSEFNRIVQSTTFNGQSVLDITQLQNGLQIQVGSGANTTLSLAQGSDLARSVGDGTFQTGVTVAVLFNTDDVVVGDFNEDGKSDYVMGGFVMLGNGDGTFMAPRTNTVTGPLRTADLNGDGHLDLFSATGNSVSVAFGNGDGTFQLARTAGDIGGAGSRTITGITVGDFDGDGKTDLGITSFDYTPYTGSVAIFYGNGNGTFKAAATVAALTGAPIVGAISSADINGDGRLDIAARDAGTSYTNVYLAQGDGTFRVAVSVTGVGNVNLVDLNNDGFADLTRGSGGGRVYLGNGDGTFRAVATLGVNGANDITYADLNGDGYLDAIGASGNFATGLVTVAIGNGDGSFKLATTYAGYAQTGGVAAADFNGDGAADIIASQDNAGGKLYFGNVTRVSTASVFSLATVSDARAAMSLLTSQLDHITAQKGAIGAYQSRLDTALNVVRASSENSTAAASRIMDADVAAESANLIRASILQNVSSSLLAQASPAPEIALRLLDGS